jgi:hypothetical protein
LNTIVAILLAAGEASSPTADAMIGAITEALGPTTFLVLRSSVAPSDAEALQIERESRAEAVARVNWEGPGHSTAVLRTHLASSDRWIERHISFLPGDSRAERWRTLGFSVAALLLPEHDLGAAAGQLPAPNANGAGVPSAVAAVATGSAPSPASGALDPGRYDRGKLAFDLAATGALGIAGPAKGIGGAAHAEYLVGLAIFIRAGAFLRTGGVPGLDGGDTIAAAGGGLAFRPARAGGARHPFGLGVAIEALAMYHDLYHRDVSGQTLHRSRMMPALSAIVEGSWAVERSWDACVGIGAEIASGSTDVFVAGQSVAAIPPVRLVGQVGLRLHF